MGFAAAKPIPCAVLCMPDKAQPRRAIDSCPGSMVFREHGVAKMGPMHAIAPRAIRGYSAGHRGRRHDQARKLVGRVWCRGPVAGGRKPKFRKNEAQGEQPARHCSAASIYRSQDQPSHALSTRGVGPLRRAMRRPDGPLAGQQLGSASRPPMDLAALNPSYALVLSSRPDSQFALDTFNGATLARLRRIRPALRGDHAFARDCFAICAFSRG
jgi:hypothetical protein